MEIKKLAKNTLNFAINRIIQIIGISIIIIGLFIIVITLSDSRYRAR